MIHSAAVCYVVHCRLAPMAAAAAAGMNDPSDRQCGARRAAALPSAAALRRPSPTRRIPSEVYWGDQHVHTGWSADAGLAGATLGPEDAVRFARGEKVKSSTGQDRAARSRPFDWIAVTDHSDGMGTINELQAGNAEFMHGSDRKSGTT